MTGGIGRKNLIAFYRDHFIFSNPQDSELELISRTVGVDRVVDEFIYKCTHDRVVDWLYVLTCFYMSVYADQLELQAPGRPSYEPIP